MASGYALPVNGGRSYNHGYSHSHTGIHLSPGKTIANGNANGAPTRSPNPNGSLFTHAESSRETSPAASPAPIANGDPFTNNATAFQENARLHKHRHNHSEPLMRNGLVRETDFGNIAESQRLGYEPALNTIPATSTSWFSLPEALTSMLVTLPCILSSAAYSSMGDQSASTFPPLSRYAVPFSLNSDDLDEWELVNPRRYDALDACILTSGTLLVVGIFAKMQSFGRASSKGKDVARNSLDLRGFLKWSSLNTMTWCALSIWLPFYASMLLGGSRTGLVLLITIAANLTSINGPTADLMEQWKDLWASKVGTSMVILLSFIIDEIGWTIQAPVTDIIIGYMALAASLLILPPPFPIVIADSTTSKSTRSFSTAASSISCPLIYSKAAADLTLASGSILALLTVLASILLSYSPYISSTSLILITLTVASMAAAILFSQPQMLRSESKAGLALGCFTTASSSFLFSPSIWPGTVCNGGLSALAFLGVLYDTQGNDSGNDDHDHVQHIHTHHQHNHGRENVSSVFTKFLLAQCEPGSLIFGILSEKDSRRIAYFTILNFGYMLVQGVYGYLSGSLGLLSDTVHMFFDCLGLVVGLGAAIASRWPTSPDWPYGWGKLNTLSGFGNGIFLMLVSVEFVWEAIEGLLEQRQLRHVQELLVVSVLGLLVNIVGLVFFHSHAGHDHGHGHSHGHDHGHSHSHNHAHSHNHSHAHEHDHSHSNGSVHAHNSSIHHHHPHEHSHDHSHGHVHSHTHGNENMHGIFLHIAADAGGSLAVILSTALNIWYPSYLWDPLATILIAMLIFAAAVPLVTSSGQKLLLVMPNELEYHIKNMLQDLGDLRGVVGYSVPRFWEDDNDQASDDSHDHDGECKHGGKKRIMGVVHVVVEASADLDDVRERVEDFIAERNMDILIQVERDGEGQCWCTNRYQNSE